MLADTDDSSSDPVNSEQLNTAVQYEAAVACIVPSRFAVFAVVATQHSWMLVTLTHFGDSSFVVGSFEVEGCEVEGCVMTSSQVFLVVCVVCSCSFVLVRGDCSSDNWQQIYSVVQSYSCFERCIALYLRHESSSVAMMKE